MASVLLPKAEEIYRAALRSVDPGVLIRKNVSRRGDRLVIRGRVYDLASFDRVVLAAIGKAAPSMTAEIACLLGKRLTGGVVLCPSGTKARFKRLACLPAAHPLPDGRSVAAARDILRLARRSDGRDLFLVLISGGGSSQVALPRPGVTLQEKRRLTGALLRAGADISELNSVRKHLSAIKGGWLARAAFPATIINLVISDVRGNDLETIASGPTHADSSTFRDAKRVLKKYGLWESAPRGPKDVIERGIEGKIGETLKPGDPAFRKVRSFILGDNHGALEAAKARASELGFNSRIIREADSGEAASAAREYLAAIDRISRRARSRPAPRCLIAGGELTVTVLGSGKGGRNQEFILACLHEISKRRRRGAKFLFDGAYRDWLFLSLGTDGIDGPTDAAGAWIGPASLAGIRKSGLDLREFLLRNDSYGFFKRTGGLIKTGPTGTNVMDLRIFILAGSPGSECLPSAMD